MDRVTLEQKYGLHKTIVVNPSGLIRWYNRLIEKTAEELDVQDVLRMARQKILIDVAGNRAVDLFLTDPFAGEIDDGDLLELLVSMGDVIKKNVNKQELKRVIDRAKKDMQFFEWDSEENKVRFQRNLDKLNYILQ